jgi:Delta6-protoilludene synthase
MGDDGTNILTIIMHQDKVDLNEAVEHACRKHKAAAEKLIYLLDHLPSFEDAEVHKNIREYVIETVVASIRGNYEWSFEGRRYFREKGPEIRSTRRVLLRRRGNPDGTRVPVNV